ncbi:DUF3617 domain-containing protein [Sphingomonas sp. BIUV-7]|uniref:DUF3617 domain-containing protein n=1 Tax=Sphingomonas natans TaxID=3063330 RepID=A0ABT8YDS0_9SPHN|nr:DUF3617 domain-containing protein [Sphingomonas sp. BIUV-7]MDO6416492.1 DUF3617 domain-containing protein [Sphingomonas sp. BIUV-7]
MNLRVWGASLLLVASAAPAASPIQPGLWEMTTKIDTISMPGAPPAMAAAMRRPKTIRTCITAEQAAQGPRGIQQADKSCKIGRYDWAGGKYVAEIVCSRPTGTMTTRSTGTYTPTSFNSKSQMSSTGQMKMAMTMTASGRRVGLCKR